jgi:hypothetical protein
MQDASKSLLSAFNYYPIQNAFLKNLPNIFSPEIVVGLTDDEVRDIAAESKDSAEERKELEMKLVALKDTQKTLHLMGQRKPIGMSVPIQSSKPANDVSTSNEVKSQQIGNRTRDQVDEPAKHSTVDPKGVGKRCESRTQKRDDFHEYREKAMDFFERMLNGLDWKPVGDHSHPLVIAGKNLMHVSLFLIRRLDNLPPRKSKKLRERLEQLHQSLLKLRDLGLETLPNPSQENTIHAITQLQGRVPPEDSEGLDDGSLELAWLTWARKSWISACFRS